MSSTALLKNCWACKTQKPTSEFFKNRSRPDGLAHECKTCSHERTTAWRKQNPERSREHVRKGTRRHRYGADVFEWIAARLKEQGNACAICKTAFEGEPHVDHDHKTGARRGLLCTRCNTGIGMFLDNPERLRVAALYLEG